MQFYRRLSSYDPPNSATTREGWASRIALLAKEARSRAPSLRDLLFEILRNQLELIFSKTHA
jgi:hypothetical protein